MERPRIHLIWTFTILTAIALFCPSLAKSKSTLEGNVDDLLISAAFHGRQNEVETLLQRGANVNAIDPTDGSTPLIVAVQRDHASLVRFLLNKGADVRAKDNSGFTALVYAAKPEIARMLLEKGSDPNPRGLDNMTPLIKASAYGNLELARTFIRKGTDLNAKDNLGRSALTAAIENGFPEIAHILLRARADIEVADKNGLTPLMRATSGHQLEIMRILLDRGADPNTKNKAGDSALVYAIGNAEAIALLADKGADVNLRYGTDGMTVLMMAAARGEYRVAETLLKNGAEVNLKSQKGETALSLAQRFGHKQLVNLLQKHGASE